MPHNNGRGQCKNLQEIDPPKGNPHIVYFPYKPGIHLWAQSYGSLTFFGIALL